MDQNYVAFLIAARALREWGANYVTGVLPYPAYARQDKPTAGECEPATANLLADLSIASRIDRLVTWHPHSPPDPGLLRYRTGGQKEVVITNSNPLELDFTRSYPAGGVAWHWTARRFEQMCAEVGSRVEEDGEWLEILPSRGISGINQNIKKPRGKRSETENGKCCSDSDR